MGLFWTNEIDADGRESKNVNWGTIILSIATLTLTSKVWLGWLKDLATHFHWSGVADSLGTAQTTMGNVLNTGAQKLGITGGTAVTAATSPPTTPIVGGGVGGAGASVAPCKP